MQSPCDGHRSITFMGYVIGGTEENVGRRAQRIRFGLADKQKDVGPAYAVVNVSLPRRRRRRGRRLGFPVKQLRAYREVAVHRCRRVIAIGLLQRDEERVGIDRRTPRHSLTHRARRPLQGSESQRRQDLLTGVGRVDLQGHISETRHQAAKVIRGSPCGVESYATTCLISSATGSLRRTSRPSAISSNPPAFGNSEKNNISAS